MNTRLREFGGMAALKGAPTEEELAIIAHEDFAGERLEPTQIHVRRMLLCHDQYDRTYERFPADVLRRFADTLPGRSVLACHATGGLFRGDGHLPLARFFQASLQKRQEDAFPILRRGRPEPGARVPRRAPQHSGPDAPPPGFDLEPVKVTYLRAGFYFPNHDSTEGLRVNLDTGVYKWVSIGFRYDDLTCDLCGKSYLTDWWEDDGCPHLLGRTYEQDDRTPTAGICTGTYSGNLEFFETLEGSVVYLGGQQRGRMIKSMVSDGRVNVEQLSTTPYGEDLVLRKEAEDLARHYGSDKRFFSVGDKPTDRTSDDDTAPVGLSLADDAQHVLACVGGLVDRAFDARDQRAAKGKRLGAGTLDGLRNIRAALDDLLQLDDQPVPATDALRAAADAIATDAKARAMSLGLV